MLVPNKESFPMCRWISRAVGVAAWLAASAAQAATVAGVTPQGEVALVRQIVVRFSEAVVPFGRTSQPDPAQVSCEGTSVPGDGRWSSDRVWLYDFREALPGGARCEITVRADWQPQSGALEGERRFSFSTGGPAVASVQPYPGSEIEEDQHFLMELTAPAQAASVSAHAACEVEGIGERIPMQVVTGAARDAVLKERRLQAKAARMLLLACQRPSPSGAKVRVVWGAGVAAQANPKQVTRQAQRFDYTVRTPLAAEFSCERERSDAACLPIRPMVLRFSSPVPRSVAQAVRLMPDAGAALAPVFDADDRAEEVSELRFPSPLPENTRYLLVIDAGVRDVTGRALSNADAFPMAVATGAAPPLAKFAAAPFGVVEWDGEALLPLTLRHVQGDLRPAAPAGAVRIKTLRSDADIFAWHAKVAAYHERSITAEAAGLPRAQWHEMEKVTDARGRVREVQRVRYVRTRELPLLSQGDDVRRLDLPQLQGGDPRPFEVIGIPLREPGYHVVEIESRGLGQALLDKPAPMYVRTGVLVTNLGVHFKWGRENSLVWVTSLDRGRPVPDAEVRVSDCAGRPVWSGRTGPDGIARIERALGAPECRDGDGYFVTARKTLPKSPPDTAFVFSEWQQGVEPWRFGHPTHREPEPDVRAHTVFDRTLLRAGDTVSMKHFVRRETGSGLAALPPEERPVRMTIVHQGSGQEVAQPLSWPGGRSASSSWQIPQAARLGVYDVKLERAAGPDGVQHAPWYSGIFQVEEFRVPLVDARISGPQTVPIAPRELPLQVQLSHLSGGGMANAPVRVTALLRERRVQMPGYEDFSFDPPRDLTAGESEDDADDASLAGRVIADRQPLTTDREGAAHVVIGELPTLTRASELVAEVSFNDPNGEVQTVSARTPLWPSAVVLGVRSQSWASTRGQVMFQAVALDTAGRPIAGQAVEVRGRSSQVISSRKRMVGGFYAYDNRTDVRDLGVLCSGKTDRQGVLRCDANLTTAGEVALIAQARDRDGRTAQAAASVWITGQGELWFAQDNDDRIDLLPEKKTYQPGETARLQVRMPYREATALVSVEREGVMATEVVTLRGNDPTVNVKIEPTWGPNVYVSVMVLRGRLREVPWYSFFTWGWKAPISWGRAYWYEGREVQVPTAMIDLSKPSFKLGVAALKVGLAAHELQVRVTPERTQYAVREHAKVRVAVQHNGQPMAGAEVAFAAVDEGLLALRPNTSWDLLNAMLQQRPWGVETSTGQSEIIGRRHYGRKAVDAGGGGGANATRELFDTLLLWRDRVVLDARGEAVIDVPLNDSLTSFRLVAIADAGVQQFGSGSATIRVTQDLQALAGLPPLVREGDRFSAMVTLRNTTARAMTVRATLQGAPERDDGAAAEPLAAFAPQEVSIPPGAARELSWPVTVPAHADRLRWQIATDEQGGPKAKDRVTLTQRVASAVPLRVQQAAVQRLDQPVTWPVAVPVGAIADAGRARGGLVVAAQPRLSSALPGLRRYFEQYPYACLEQQLAKVVGLNDTVRWAELANALPTYLDADGLVGYFPPRAGDPAQGSDRLTAHLLSVTHEAGFPLPGPVQAQMLDGLTAFVEGRIERRFWSPRADLPVRQLAAIEALSRYGRAQPRMLGSLQIAPAQWPTAAVIDWVNILQRLDGVPQQAARRAEAQQILRSRLTYAGTTLRFSQEDDDFWWWLMDSADANAARLIIAVLDDPAWRDELPRMVLGHLARQRDGAWLTTTANLWGALALDKFAARFENVPVTGRTLAAVGGGEAAIEWTRQPEGARLTLPWPAAPDTLRISQDGTGAPWITVQSLAAVPPSAPVRAGYGLVRTVTAVQRKDPSAWSRGDVLRVRVEIQAQSDMTWVVLSDPVPAGAAILGTGLGRDSSAATSGERREGAAWAAFEERSFEAFRSYWAHLPRGMHVVEYTLRLNNPGRFVLPPTRIEAMYAPETHGELPNVALDVAP